MSKKRQRIVISFTVPDGTNGRDVIKTRRASIQLFDDGRLLIIDGCDSWVYHRVWRVIKKGG